MQQLFFGHNISCSKTAECESKLDHSKLITNDSPHAGVPRQSDRRSCPLHAAFRKASLVQGLQISSSHLWRKEEVPTGDLDISLFLMIHRINCEPIFI
jgi:hypothetical protein